MKILAAMSGGVDSSVAAAMLVRAGHDVTGVHLRLTDQSPALEGRGHGCCGVADADDARRVAQVLDIPFYVWNFKDAFARGVIDDFVGEYATGRTPNPCVRCNETVKFGALRNRALDLGFDAVATGHYARTTLDETGRWHLYRSVDAGKDQSYVLARTGQDEIATARFPVGKQTKEQTRALARELGLRTADKPDSYEICFVADGNAAGFVQRSIEIAPGEIVGTDGAVLGEHAGIHNFTVGQRKGLGINTGSARTYVLEIDAPRNRVVVGAEDLLARTGLEAERVRWIAGEQPDDIDSVQVRAHGAVHRARLLDADDDFAAVRFDEPQRAIAPGQLVAFYRGDEVLGGGTIARATR